jgi:hypothetical protein
MGQLERPFLLFNEGRPTHLFAATMNGPGGFTNATESYALCIPLKGCGGFLPGSISSACGTGRGEFPSSP